MTKWILTACLLLAGLLAACSGSAGAPSRKTVPSPSPDFSDLFAETNQLYDRLEANTPIEVTPANASAQTIKMIVPTLF